MKATKAAVKSLTKGGIAEAVAAETELKKSEVTKVLNSLANVAATEVKKGKFTIPGVCMIKTRTKPATKAGDRAGNRAIESRPSLPAPSPARGRLADAPRARKRAGIPSRRASATRPRVSLAARHSSVP